MVIQTVVYLYLGKCKAIEMNKLTIHATTCMNLQKIMSSKKAIPKDNYCMFPCT